MNIKKVITIASLLSLSSFVFAGNKSGGGDFCSLEGTKCERVNFEASSIHPFGNELIEMIKVSKLPVVLKEEMLRDLSSTLVIYSDERIKAQELISKYHMQIVGKSTETTRDAKGNITQTVERIEEEYVRKLNDLNIYINSNIGYKAGNLDDLYVRAVTEVGSPNRVIYFKSFVNSNMDKKEAMKLVLHEQGHRLKHLKSLSMDERFVEGWASKTLQFLNKEIPLKAYQSFLRASELDSGERIEFSNKKRLKGSTDRYEADLTLELKESDLIRSALSSRTNYVMLVKKSAFSGIPVLENDNVKIHYKVPMDISEEMEQYILTELFSGKPTKLKVNFSEKVTDWNSNDMPVQQKLNSVTVINPREKHLEELIVHELKELNQLSVKLLERTDITSTLFSPDYPTLYQKTSQVLKKFKAILKEELSSRENKKLEFMLTNMPPLIIFLKSLSNSEFSLYKNSHEYFEIDGKEVKVNKLGVYYLGIDISKSIDQAALDLFNALMDNFNLNLDDYINENLKSISKVFEAPSTGFIKGKMSFKVNSLEELEWIHSLTDVKEFREKLACLSKNMPGQKLSFSISEINYGQEINFDVNFKNYDEVVIDLALPAHGFQKKRSKLFSFIVYEALDKVFSRVEKETNVRFLRDNSKYTEIPSKAVLKKKGYKWTKDRDHYLGTHNLSGAHIAIINAAKACK